MRWRASCSVPNSSILTPSPIKVSLWGVSVEWRTYQTSFRTTECGRQLKRWRQPRLLHWTPRCEVERSRRKLCTPVSNRAEAPKAEIEAGWVRPVVSIELVHSATCWEFTEAEGKARQHRQTQKGVVWTYGSGGEPIHKGFRPVKRWRVPDGLWRAQYRERTA